MNVSRPFATRLLLIGSSVGLSSVCFSVWAGARKPRPGAQTDPLAAQGSKLRDGRHDFDFDIGSWKTHTSRLQHPLTGSTTWTEMEGITVVQKIWDGRGNLAALESDGQTGHLELLSLRLYDPQAHQWNLNFATSNVGTVSVPMFGEFKNGRGEFVDQEPFNGRSILVRFNIFPTGANSARSEQAFSDDGGKTWETNWINTYTRLPEDSKSQ
jgi:hypothetical protein